MIESINLDEETIIKLNNKENFFIFIIMFFFIFIFLFKTFNFKILTNTLISIFISILLINSIPFFKFLNKFINNKTLR